MRPQTSADLSDQCLQLGVTGGLAATSNCGAITEAFGDMAVNEPGARIEFFVHVLPPEPLIDVVAVRDSLAGQACWLFGLGRVVVLTGHVVGMRQEHIAVGGASLRTAIWGEGPPEIVLLHDGLGSIPQWRGVPQRLAETTGQTVLVYERPGHGESTPVPEGAWPTDWLHGQAELLEQLLIEVGAASPIVIGHSDGGSTALIHAAQKPNSVRAVAALAPHSWVEVECFDAIEAMRANHEPIVAGLGKYHLAAAAVFEAWSGVWVSDAFRNWDIRPELASIVAPTLIAQGADDSYATDDQAHLTARAIGENARSQIVAGVGHIMHHDNEDIVVGLLTNFVADLGVAG